MGHMLATMNPEAAHEIEHPTALPGVGSPVVYCPRPGQIRAGRSRVPAIVLKADGDNGLLDLVVIYDADDFLSVRDVPRRQGEDRGWEPASDSAGAVLEKLEAFKGELAEVLFGLNVKPEVDILTQLSDIRERLAILEAKRGPGRPPNVLRGED